MDDGILMNNNRVYVPNSSELRKLIMSEMHKVPYVGHLVYQKAIAIVRRQHFWTRMKKDVVKHIAICMEWQSVKVKHICPT